MSRTAVILFLFMILAVPQVSALGITPGGKTVMFEPNKEFSASVSVLNTEHSSFSAVVYAEGGLAGYITFSPDRLEFTEKEDEKSFTYTIRLPEELKPGEHLTRIKVREVPDNTSPGTVTTLIGVVHQLRVLVVYPGKYPVVDLNIVQGDNNTVLFLLPVFNLGETDIEEAHAEIEILTPKNISLANLTSNKIKVGSRHRRELVARTGQMQPGKYTARVKIRFDGQVDELETEFSVGEFYLKLISINVGKFQLGEIARFNILVENIANVDIPDAYSKIILKDNASRTVADMKSVQKEIPANSKSEFLTYWDTEGIEPAVYTGRATLLHDSKSSDTPITAIVSKDKAKVVMEPITGLPIEQIPEPADPLRILKQIILLLVLVNICLLLYIKFYHQKKREDKNKDSKN